MQDNNLPHNEAPHVEWSRKHFLRTVGAGALGLGAAALGCQTDGATSDAPNVITGKTYRWNMVTTWPPNFPILGAGCSHFAQWVEEMSGGQLQIRVYGGGELIPALEAFDAVSSRTAEIGSGAAYYWAGKSPSTQFFGAIPFGLNAQQVNTWLYSGGGMALWEEVYNQFNVIPLVGGNTGVQMGGWFNRRIDSLRDLRGLKMRIPGLGGKVLGKAGGTAVLSPGSEIYTNLERGVIDATEWIGPYHDYLMGFHQIADYYYYPGWHEPTAVLELFVNKPTFERLPGHLQTIIRTAAYRLNLWMLTEFEAKNAEYLQKIRDETDVQVLPFPAEVIAGLRTFSQEVLDELVASDPLSKRVYESFSAFKKKIKAWAEVGERRFYNEF
ncbi:MAG: TRAP transporter substrate-binding protein [Saprospiraceae bacterium]|nr:TRAP transporter substrate-binding protein [Saprospiraceae bacterium]